MKGIRCGLRRGRSLREGRKGMGITMNQRDWDFAIGDLGDPLADIKEWMLPPYPAWLPEWVKRGEVHDLLVIEEII